MTDIFAAVLDLSIRGSYVIITALLLRLLLRRQPKWIACLLWLVVAVRLAVPFSLHSSFGVQPVWEFELPENAQTVLPAAEAQVPEETVKPMGTAVAGEFPPQAQRGQIRQVMAADVLSWIWMTGITAMALYGLISWWQLKRRVFSAVQDNGIWKSERITAPFVSGIFRPRIYLPFALEERYAQSVIAHEKAHLRRLDHIFKPLFFCLLAIHWFNPLVWAAYLCLCRDMELACDERVIRDMEYQQRQEYAKALLCCSTGKKYAALAPLSFGEVGVMARIKNVMAYRKCRFWLTAGAVLIAAVIIICALAEPMSFGDVAYVLVVTDHGGQKVEGLSGMHLGSTHESGIMHLETEEKTDVLSFTLTSLEEKSVTIRFDTAVTDVFGNVIETASLTSGKSVTVYQSTESGKLKHTIRAYPSDPERFSFGFGKQEKKENLYVHTMQVYAVQTDTIPGPYVYLNENGSFRTGPSLAMSMGSSGTYEIQGALLELYPREGGMLTFQLGENSLRFREDLSKQNLWFANDDVLLPINNEKAGE